ncbi:hypothetical protein [Flexivirga alba]|uniref:DUF998 domain-containing protein n=1 Tax=Flexivirga alba TaxID=702742 RepID=A0ABW2ALN8_9MICO
MTAVHAARPALAGKVSNRTTADRVRRRLAVGAVLATFPYSALKVAWLCRSRIGLSDAKFGTSATMHLLNTATLGLDLVALALALVFFTGARAPRWFLLPTMWVGYGLLGQIVMIIGPSVIVQATTGPPTDASSAATPIAGWVYAAVYTGFSGLGLCLLPAFAIYAWQRWGADRGWGERLAGVRRDRLPKLPALATATLVLALVVRSAFADSALEAMGPAIDAVIGLMALAGLWSGVAGRPRRLRRAVPMAVVWTASGAWTAWGVYHLVLQTVPNDLVTGQVAGIDIALSAAKALTGASLLFAIRRIS